MPKDLNVLEAQASSEVCEIDPNVFGVEPFTIVIFGGAGDLSQRKLLPTLYHIFKEHEIDTDFRIIGFGMPEFSEKEYQDIVEKAFHKFIDSDFDDKTWKAFKQNLHYVASGFDDEEKFKELSQKVQSIGQKNNEGKINLIYYMAVPPNFTATIVDNLKKHGMCKDKFSPKIIVEKPFGTNQKTARKLNQALLAAFDENQIYRIDHYLGKETVQNIMFFRFANSIFEPLWNHRYIDNVQITVAEDIGIEHRGAFYEKAGVVRDIMQNHIMQLIGLVAMEPPVGFSADFIRDEKVKVFRSIRKMDNDYISKNTVIGQYDSGIVNDKHVVSYREEEKVLQDSVSSTFIAAKLYVDNWRWANVPFYVRTGKRMPKRCTDICIQFRQPPLRLFGKECENIEPNVLIIRIQPDEAINLHLGVKSPEAINRIYPIHLDFKYEDVFKEKTHPPYERLILDCMKGDLTLFVRQDGVEAMWEAVDPIIAYWESSPTNDFPNYESGTWGPDASKKLLKNSNHDWITK
ncbi:glucose-6-phosphate dehydrogenase [bacterium]